eukprot:6471710-Amphidinium_carterae.1
MKVSESHAAALDFPDGVAPHLCILPSTAGVPCAKSSAVGCSTFGCNSPSRILLDTSLRAPLPH